jgi:hypothetical protein
MCHGQHSIQSHSKCSSRYAKRMTVRDMLTALQTLPRDAELLAFEAAVRTTASASLMRLSGRAAGCTCT